MDKKKLLALAVAFTLMLTGTGFIAHMDDYADTAYCADAAALQGEEQPEVQNLEQYDEPAPQQLEISDVEIWDVDSDVVIPADNSDKQDNTDESDKPEDEDRPAHDKPEEGAETDNKPDESEGPDEGNKPEPSPSLPPYIVIFVATNGEVIETVGAGADEIINARDITEQLAEGETFIGWFALPQTEDVGELKEFDFASPVSEQIVEGQHELILYPWIECAEVERTVTLTIDSRDNNLNVGSEVTLRAALAGFEGVQYTIVWQSSPVDNEGIPTDEWSDVENTGDDQLSYTYTVTPENKKLAWRVAVNMQ